MKCRLTRVRVVVASVMLTAVLGLAAAPEASALPPSSANVTYNSLNISAQCSANGAGGVYAVVGQVTPKLPYTTATIRCTVNGQPTLASVPTATGLVGAFVPLGPLLVPGPSGTAAGIALVTGDDVTICLISDVTVAAPLLPPIREHVERCS